MRESGRRDVRMEGRRRGNGGKTGNQERETNNTRKRGNRQREGGAAGKYPKYPAFKPSALPPSSSLPSPTQRRKYKNTFFKTVKEQGKTNTKRNTTEIKSKGNADNKRNTAKQNTKQSKSKEQNTKQNKTKTKKCLTLLINLHTKTQKHTHVPLFLPSLT